MSEKLIESDNVKNSLDFVETIFQNIVQVEFRHRSNA